MKTVITSKGKTKDDHFDLRFGRAAWFCVFDEATGKFSFIENDQAEATEGAGTKAAEKMVEESRKQAVRRIVDTNERIPFEVRRYLKKDVVDIAVDKLDKLYEKWKQDEEVKSEKELKKRYIEEKKKIKKTLI